MRSEIIIINFIVWPYYDGIVGFKIDELKCVVWQAFDREFFTSIDVFFATWAILTFKFKSGLNSQEKLAFPDSFSHTRLEERDEMNVTMHYND